MIAPSIQQRWSQREFGILGGNVFFFSALVVSYLKRIKANRLPTATTFRPGYKSRLPLKINIDAGTVLYKRWEPMESGLAGDYLF